MDERIDQLLSELDAIARSRDGYDYGLPIYGELLDAMRDAVKRYFNDALRSMPD